MKFLIALAKNEVITVRDYLCGLNKGAAPTSNILSRTIVLMDATGSMSHLLQKAKTTVAMMFSRAKEILKEKGLNPDCFEIQFAVYRNYSSGKDLILVSSPWESNPNNLKAFMDNTRVEGGMGAEAIEIGLWHANQEAVISPITQVILIGDAPANSQKEVISRRGVFFGENYWSNTKFKAQAFYQTEVQQLNSKNIKIHSFYVASYAKLCFEEIAKSTGGNSFFLDVNDPIKGSALLTDSVTIEILKDVGKDSGKGDELVKAYQAKVWT